MCFIQKLPKQYYYIEKSVNSDYQQDSRALYRFVSIKSFGQLLNISPKSFVFLKAFDSELSYIEVWFNDENSKPLEIEVRSIKNDAVLSSTQRSNIC